MKLFDISGPNEPTEEEWKAIFSYPKYFESGDIVEYGSSVWEVEELQYEMPEYKPDGELVYRLKNLKGDDKGRIAWASSSLMAPLGTFVDTEEYNGHRTPRN